MKYEHETYASSLDYWRYEAQYLKQKNKKVLENVSLNSLNCGYMTS